MIPRAWAVAPSEATAQARGTPVGSLEREAPAVTRRSEEPGRWGGDGFGLLPADGRLDEAAAT